MPFAGPVCLSSTATTSGSEVVSRLLGGHNVLDAGDHWAEHMVSETCGPADGEHRKLM